MGGVAEMIRPNQFGLIEACISPWQKPQTERVMKNQPR